MKKKTFVLQVPITFNKQNLPTSLLLIASNFSIAPCILQIARLPKSQGVLEIRSMFSDPAMNTNGGFQKNTDTD